MSDLLTEPLAPVRPIERHCQLETDLFCEHCGYNLHGQPVWRDERLGIMICRCPECGRFHPAAQRSTATSLWLSRLASAMLLLWVLTVLATVVFTAIGFGGLQLLHVDLFTYRRLVANDGREIEWNRTPTGAGGYVYVGTTQPAQYHRMLRVLTPPVDQRHYRAGWGDITLIALLSIAMGLVFGILLVVVLWHWRRRNYPWVMLLPFIAGLFVCAGISLDDDYELVRTWGFQRVFFWGSIQALAMGLGIVIGRPFARLLVRMFIPPRPRQYLAFLWRADGKTPPAAATVT